MMFLPRLLYTVAVLSFVFPVQASGSTPAAIAGDTAFPAAEPASVGLRPAALAELSDIVAAFVDDGTVVGAELLVVKNRRTVLHEAFGLDDNLGRRPMRQGTLFNIRSMTKPVTGTVAQMLADEGVLAFGDRVAEHLPSFDNERSGAITIEHLLTHRSGLPMTVANSFADLTSLADLADRAGERGPDTPPGSAFHYSDAGSDAAGRVLEVISGNRPLSELLQERVLDPLDMRDSLTVIEPGSALLPRVAHAYMGQPGQWHAYWTREQDPIYPFSMGSQSLYCTTIDYARFLALWLDRGLHAGNRLLSEAAVARAFTPISDMEVNLTSLRDLRTRYGQMWIVWLDEQGELELFGHSGSDGTWAWAWPEHDLMVLYFTQSRGQGSGITLERDIDRLLVRPEFYLGDDDVDSGLAACAGWYHDPSAPFPAEFEILGQDGGLAVRLLPQNIVSPLLEPDESGQWTLALDPNVRFSFIRDDEGPPTAMVMHAGPSQTIPLALGRAPQPAALDLEAVTPLLGIYHDVEADLEVEVHVHEGRLAVTTPAYPAALGFHPADGDGFWALMVNPTIRIRFDADDDGRILSYTVHSPLGQTVRPRLRGPQQGDA